jgi:hypothetical protein
MLVTLIVRNYRIFGIVLCFAASFAAAQTNSTPVSVNGRVPLGIESFRLEPANQEFYLMASAENPAFFGLRRFSQNQRRDRLIERNGSELKFYPQRVQFRLTASAREKLMDDHPFDTESKLSLEELLVQLRFRVKIFHGLEYHYVEPEFVEDIGMPRRLPYDERIYRIGFNLEKVPITDRVVMEVLTPSGSRLCKFHLDLL